MVYGYARVSTAKQNIERQIRNIHDKHSDAYIFQDTYTGTKMSRPAFDKMLGIVKSGDTIVFDSVSRMSRDAQDGVRLYNELMSKGIELEFIKEPHINTVTYKDALQNQTELQMTGDIIDCILKGINEYMRRLTERQIELAFESAENEVKELRQRTVEGLITAKLNGKQVGNVAGVKLTTQKSIQVKDFIMEYSKDFGGNNTDAETISIIHGKKYYYKDASGKVGEKSLKGLGRGTYYKYKAEIKAELEKMVEDDFTDDMPINIDSVFEDEI